MTEQWQPSKTEQAVRKGLVVGLMTFAVSVTVMMFLLFTLFVYVLLP